MRDWPETVRPLYRRAVFLDRDGTINVDKHYTHRVEDLELIDGAASAIRALAALPVHLIVVTNQAGIALGRYEYEDMSRFNRALLGAIEDAGGRIDAFYYSPEKEAKDLSPGETQSPHSKPAPGMLLEAAADYDLDLPRSFLIGDKASDITAGQSARCFSLLVQTGKAGREAGADVVTPDAEVPTIAEAVELIRQMLTQAGGLDQAGG